jgi:hypothetical protein
LFDGGRIPVRIAGVATSVSHCTVVALRYQVEVHASAAKFG